MKFISDDGKVFGTMSECADYESELAESKTDELIRSELSRYLTVVKVVSPNEHAQDTYCAVLYKGAKDKALWFCYNFINKEFGSQYRLAHDGFDVVKVYDITEVNDDERTSVMCKIYKKLKDYRNSNTFAWDCGAETTINFYDIAGREAYCKAHHHKDDEDTGSSGIDCEALSNALLEVLGRVFEDKVPCGFIDENGFYRV